MTSSPGCPGYDGETGEPKILDETPGEDKRAELEAAVEACPTEALSIAED